MCDSTPPCATAGGDPNRQLQLELKAFTKEDREQLLHGAGFTISVPAGQGLAMRCGVASMEPTKRTEKVCEAGNALIIFINMYIGG